MPIVNATMIIKRGLGKGLSSLIPTKQQGTRAPHLEREQKREATAVLSLDPRRISANPYQPRSRFEEEKLLELIESIRMHGIITPLLVTRTGDDAYELISGERRLRAALELGLDEVPVIVREAHDQHKFEVALIENIQRADLNAIELARAYERMSREFSLTQDEIGRRLGQSRARVANTVRLLQLPHQIQESLIVGEITEGHAKVILSLTSIESQLNLWKKITMNKLTVRNAEEEAKFVHVMPHERVIQNREVAVTEAEQRLEEKLGTKVVVKGTAERGKILIEYFSKEDLARIARNV